MYRLAKSFLFRTDPERAHDLVLRGLELASQSPGALRLLRNAYRLDDERLRTTCFGLEFPNPIGLAAGFDKNARAVPAWEALGFGFVEIGSVTALPQPGNPKPRLFRLPQDEAVINRMGFNNDGADRVARRLAQLFEGYGKPPFPLGINLGKSKVTPLEEASSDYLRSLTALWPFGDYFVINVSSPNTPGLRKLQDKARLEELLITTRNFVLAQPQSKALLLKIAPELGFAQIDEIVALVQAYGLDGLIATNTTSAREGLSTVIDETGGLSGKPLRDRSLEVLTHIYSQVGDSLPLVSVGGIATPDDVRARLAAGARLVQLYTSLIYQGPGLVKSLTKGLM